jgi:hypothetical protein
MTPENPAEIEVDSYYGRFIRLAQSVRTGRHRSVWRLARTRLVTKNPDDDLRKTGCRNQLALATLLLDQKRG